MDYIYIYMVVGWRYDVANASEAEGSSVKFLGCVMDVVVN